MNIIIYLQHVATHDGLWFRLREMGERVELCCFVRGRKFQTYVYRPGGGTGPWVVMVPVVRCLSCFTNTRLRKLHGIGITIY